jgi:phosphatidylserine/phosphatidylglycerophosphate/cardiolipin synthase-like enzyme
VRLRARTIVIPCVSFAVRVRLSEVAGGITPVERIVLMAIGAGLDSVDALAQTLKLGRRLLLDLIYDFWHKNYVVIDDERASVQLTPEVQAAHDAGKLDALATAENNVELVSLIQELVSGAVLPNIARPTPQGSDSMLVPTIMGGLELADIPRAALLTALERAAARQSRQAKRPQTVREAWIEPGQLLSDAAGASRRVYLTLLVDVVQQRGSSALEFDIIDAPEVSPVVRRSIERGLTKLARELPNHLFFKRLRQQLDGSDDVGGATEPLEELRRAVADLGEVDPGVLAGRHEAFVRLHDDVRQDLAERAGAQAAVRAVIGHDEQEAALAGMLATAQHQVVLGNPWLSLPTLLAHRDGGSWFDRFEQALARGVQVVLLWGISAAAELDPKVRSALHDLRARHHPRFIWSSRPSVMHAKFAIQDAHAALVTSYNFFDPRERSALEIGLLVAGPSPRTTTAALLEMLRWTRDTFPDYRQARRILVLPDDLGAEAPGLLPAETPPAPDLGAPEDVRLPAIRHWARSWQATANELTAQRRSLHRGADLVVDRMHRDALAHALKHCSRRLTVLSDKLSVDVVTDEMVSDLRQRLVDGAACTLLFRREGASDLTSGPATRLQPLAVEFPRSFVMTTSNSHAKVLLCDDEVVVGSFNFLSYGGDYDRTMRAERAELSIRVHDPSVVQAIADALASRWPDAFAVLARRNAPHDPVSPARTESAQLQPLFTALRDEREPGSLLLRWFAGRTRPWADLDALRDAGVAEALLARAVAAALASAAADEPDGQRWLWWLVEQRWRDCDFLGCALLAPPSGSGPLGLNARLAFAAAAVEAPALEYEAASNEDDLHPGRGEAWVLLAIVDVLVHGRPASARLLAGSLERCARHVQRWARAAATYHALASGPLPWQLLRARAGAQARRQVLGAARDHFVQALATAEQVGFRFPLGQHTWDALRSPSQPLGAMRAALATDDPDALQRYFSQLDQTERTLAAIMDEQSLVHRDAHNRRIEGPKRRVCLERLRQAEVAARDWIASARAPAVGAADSHLLGACWQLRSALKDLAAPESTPLDALAEPVRRYALTRMQALFEAEGP